MVRWTVSAPGSGGIAGLSKTPHFIDLPRGLKPAIFRAVASSPDNRSLADCIADIAALACDVFFLFYRNFWTPGHHGYIDMLLAVPKYGRVKTNRILNQCRISPSKTIGGLSERQRTELVSLLRR